MALLNFSPDLELGIKLAETAFECLFRLSAYLSGCLARFCDRSQDFRNYPRSGANTLKKCSADADTKLKLLFY
jgi:hypothetical protein